MRAWTLALLLAAGPVSAAPAPKTAAAKALEGDRAALQASLAEFETVLKSSPAGQPFMAELTAFKGRAKRARSREELEPVKTEFDAWRGDTLAKLNSAWPAERAQTAAPIPVFPQTSIFDPAGVKPVERLEDLAGGLRDSGGLSRFYDRAGGGSGGVFVPRGSSAADWARPYQAQPAPFKSDVALIAAKASVPPPEMVDDRRMSSYQKMVSYLTRIMHKSGLYEKLVALGVDPLPFMLSMVKSESDFRQGAVSEAGAYGYMQVLVPTAKETLRRNRAFYEEETGRKLYTKNVTGQSLISDWKTNIIAGTLYLKEQVERFDGLVRDLPTPRQQGAMLINLIASAYNAGEAGLTKFLLGKSRVTWSEVEGVEHNEKAKARVLEAAADPTRSIVGYRETRGYVKKIQSWYEQWRTAWSSWAGSRVPSAVSA